MKKYKFSDFALIAFIIVWYAFIGCPLKFFTGISCAGCGMSRACLSLLKGDFALAWHYHPLIYVMPFIAVAFILRNRMSSKTRKVLLVAVFALFTVTYIIRICTGNDVVSVDFENSAVYSLFYKLFSGG